MTTLKRNRYYLMRHGESLANRRGIIVSRPENALHDFGLTALGAEQVMSAALTTRLGADTVIISSDFKRALETAEVMHSVLACDSDIVIDTGLRERCFGDWELMDYERYDTVWQNDIKQPQTSINGVETVQAVLHRGLSVVDRLEDRYLNKKILMVGHGDVLQILLAHHHNINPRFHRSLSSIDNASIRSLENIERVPRSPAA